MRESRTKPQVAGESPQQGLLPPVHLYGTILDAKPTRRACGHVAHCGMLPARDKESIVRGSGVGRSLCQQTRYVSHVDDRDRARPCKAGSESLSWYFPGEKVE